MYLSDRGLLWLSVWREALLHESNSKSFLTFLYSKPLACRTGGLVSFSEARDDEPRAKARFRLSRALAEKYPKPQVGFCRHYVVST